MTQKVRKAVFPAAGLGTRFLPATKASPKEMLPLVAGESVIRKRVHSAPNAPRIITVCRCDGLTQAVGDGNRMSCFQRTISLRATNHLPFFFGNLRQFVPDVVLRNKVLIGFVVPINLHNHFRARRNLVKIRSPVIPSRHHE